MQQQAAAAATTTTTTTTCKNMQNMQAKCKTCKQKYGILQAMQHIKQMQTT